MFSLISNLVGLPASFKEMMVFVGGSLKMRCDGPSTSENLILIKWIMISDFNRTLILACPSDTYGNCKEIKSHILGVQNAYTSTFTMENVSLEDAREYTCVIRTFSDQKYCKFNVTITGAYTMHFSSNIMICFFFYDVTG